MIAFIKVANGVQNILIKKTIDIGKKFGGLIKFLKSSSLIILKFYKKEKKNYNIKFKIKCEIMLTVKQVIKLIYSNILIYSNHFKNIFKTKYLN